MSIRTSDRKGTVSHDFIPGHEYEFVVRAIGDDGTEEPMESAARNTIVIQGKTTLPGLITELTAVGFVEAISLTWITPDDYDYYKAEIYRSATDDITTATKLADAFGITYLDVVSAAGVTYYYWVRAVNTSGYASDFTDSVNATTLVVEATGIDDFAVTATKQYTNTVVLSADSWTNNSPGAGYVAWNEHTLVHNGACYTVGAGNTNNRYITWTVGNTGGSGTVADPYLTTYSGDAAWTAADNKFNIAVNEGGVVQMVWNSSANMVIGSAFILDAAITEAKIADLAVTAAKIANATITEAKISSLSAAIITSGSFGDARISSAATWNAKLGSGDVGDMAFEDLVEFAKLGTTIISGGYIKTGLISASNIDTGILTGRTVQTAAAGNKRGIMDGTNNNIRLLDASNNDIVNIDDDVYTGIPGMLVTGAGIVRIADGNDYAQIRDGFIQLYTETSDLSIVNATSGVSQATTEGLIRANFATGCTGNVFLGELNNVWQSKIDQAGNGSFKGYIDATGGFKDNGTAGTDGSFTVVTAVQLSSNTLQYKTRSITVSGGLVTAIGSESGWSSNGSVSLPTHSLNDHDDVSTGSPSPGDVLTFSTGYWDAL